jgi:hypothetical protein
LGDFRSHLLKTGFFRHVRELKIQMKNPGSALRILRIGFENKSESENCRFLSFQKHQRIYSPVSTKQRIGEEQLER